MKLQELVVTQPTSGALELPPGEYFGQLIIDRPLTITGQGKATWIGSRSSPTIRITSAGVRLNNLMVENTDGIEGVAIEAVPNLALEMENVICRGLIVGVPPENIRDHVRQSDNETIQISFLPPPPISVSGSDGSVGSPRTITHTGESTQAGSADTHSETPALKNVLGAGLATVQSTPSTGAVPAKRQSYWKGLSLILAVLLGGLAVVQYLDRKGASLNQAEGIRQQLKQTEEDKRLLTEQITDLKSAIAQLEKDKQTLRFSAEQTLQDIESIRKMSQSSRQKLDQEVARLTAVIQNREQEIKWWQVDNAQRQREIEAFKEDLRRLREENLHLRRSQEQIGRFENELILAAKEGDAEKLRRLLNEGALVDTADSYGWTPLMWACSRGHSDTVRLLLQRGANVNTTGLGGITPLMVASDQCRSEIVRLLLQDGADKNARTAPPVTTAIEIARKQRCQEVVMLLR